MASRLYRNVYLDSCVIVDCIQKNKQYYDFLEPLIRMCESGKLKIIVSVIARTEIYRNGEDNIDADDIINDFFRQDYVHLYSVLENTARSAGSHCKDFELYTPDAIHVATALEQKAEALITRDGTKRGRRAKFKTILSLRSNHKSRIDILTPEEFFESIPTEFKQSDLPLPEEDEEKEPEAETTA